MSEDKIEKNIFKDFNLKFELLRGLYNCGFEEPTNIQKKIITELSSSKDIFVNSPSLTGKKISFIIYSLDKVSQSKKENAQCLVLCHTREAATKIKNLYKDISKYMNIKVYALLGGTIKDDIKGLSNGTQIVIGTPGRVLDMVNKKILSLNELSFFVIDDIKQMIERDFIDTISNILNHTNDKCQKAIFNNINEFKNDSNIFILDNDLKNKLKIKEDIEMINNINNNKDKLINYKIYQISLKEDWKFNILLNLYKLMEISQAIIYCNDQQSANDLNKNLTNKKFICNELDDDKMKIISNFKKGQIRILTATSDIPTNEVNLYNNALIINYQMPNNIEEFMKRVGRNEFFGKEGMIINFITEADKNIINSLEKIVDYKIQELPIELSNIQS